MEDLLGTIGLGAVAVFALLVIGVAIMTAVEYARDYVKKHGVVLTFVAILGSVACVGMMYFIGNTIKHLYGL